MPMPEHSASDYLSIPQDVAAFFNAAIEDFEGGPWLLVNASQSLAQALGGVFGWSVVPSGSRGPLPGLGGSQVPECGCHVRVKPHGLVEVGDRFVVPAQFRLHQTAVQVGCGTARVDTDCPVVVGDRPLVLP